MRVVIQRVLKAGVSIDGVVVASVGQGLLILLGIEDADSREDAEWLCSKIVKLRVFDDAGGVMNLAAGEVGGSFLVVSQFTLHASTRKGNRPSYTRAAVPEKAIPLYEYFLEELERLSGEKVYSGKFGAMMHVSLINDGPVTILIDSRNRE
jgi:D-aminoacyl-tRNA deacylase